MKKWMCTTITGAILTAMISASVNATDQWSSSRLEPQALASIFDIDTFDSRGVTVLDETALNDTRGTFAPMLGLVMGIAALDATLAGFYWGVYVPYYAKMGPSFNPAIP